MELKECADFLQAHDRYLVVTHRRPDGDTLGCAGALCHALRRLGKTAWIFPNEEATETYLPYIEKYYAPADFAPETRVAVDVAENSMLCRGYDAPVELWIDHHASRSERSPALVLPERASCGEIVLSIIEDLLGRPDGEEADMLYIAVSTDTGCFCYGNTTSDTLRAAARLLDDGAHSSTLNKLLFRTKSRARLALEGMVFSSLLTYRENALNIAVITLEMLRSSGVTENDCDDLANLAGLVSGNRAAATVRELSAEPPLCKISLRTDGSIDAAAVCGRFGGGGHRMASGCEIALPPEEAAQVMRSALEEIWP